MWQPNWSDVVLGKPALVPGAPVTLIQDTLRSPQVSDITCVRVLAPIISRELALFLPGFPVHLEQSQREME